MSGESGAAPVPPIRVVRTDERAIAAMLGRMGELASLPHVVFRIIEAASSPDAPAAAVERAVVVDPGFAAKLLTEANRVGFEHRRISSIRDAVMRLGFGPVRNLAMAVGTFDLFAGKTDAESLRRRAWWKRSVDAGMYAKWLAHTTRGARPDDAYTAGLLHLVGRTILDRCGEAPYTRVLDAMKDRGLSLADAERRVYGAHAGEVGEAAGRHWGFPDSIAGAMNALDAPPAPDALRATVALASGLAARAEGLEETIPAWALETLGVSEDDLPTLLSEASAAIEAAQRRLAG